MRFIEQLPKLGSWRTIALLSFLSSAVSAAPRDPIAAEELFLAGRTAMGKGELGTACKAFAESERLDPAAGTLINWAECLSRQGKLMSSWFKWREALDTLPRGDERRAAAEDRLTALEPRVPRLEIQVAAGVFGAATVRRDGNVVDPATFGLALPVDPGTHRVTVTMEGRGASEYRATVAEGDREVLLVSPGPPLTGPPPSPAVHRADSALSGWVVGGIGAATTVVGATFGVLAITEKDKVDDGCSRVSGQLLCDQRGMSAAKNGDTYATIANVAVPVGLVALAAGGYLLWSSTRSHEVRTLRAVPTGMSGAQLRFSSSF